MLPPLLAVTGFAEVGKSEVVKYLAAAHSFYRPMHIKEPMVEMAIPLLRRLGITSHHEILDRLDGQRKNEALPGYPHISGRKILQALGKQFREAVDPDLYRNLWWTAAQAGAQGRPILNESLRYPDEVPFVREQGGFVLEVRRTGKNSLDPVYEPHVIGDFVLQNDGNDLTALHRVLDTFITHLRMGHREGLYLTGEIELHAGQSHPILEAIREADAEAECCGCGGCRSSG